MKYTALVPLTASEIRRQLGLSRGRWDHLKARCRSVFDTYKVHGTGKARLWSPLLLQAIREIQKSGIIRPYKKEESR